MSFEKFVENNKNNEPENPERRTILKAATGATVLAGMGKMGMEFAENENEVNKLYELLKGREHDAEFVNIAATMLLEEMNRENTESVRLVSGPGAGFGTGRIDILRDFLTKHLQSPTGSKYPFQKEVIESGVYTRKSLVDILSATTQE